MGYNFNPWLALTVRFQGAWDQTLQRESGSLGTGKGSRTPLGCTPSFANFFLCFTPFAFFPPTKEPISRLVLELLGL